MQIPAISAPLSKAPAVLEAPAKPDSVKVSQQFESILLRQFLDESMKGLLQGGPSGQVYGYLLTDSLANSMSEAGGLGLSSILQAQLGKEQP